MWEGFQFCIQKLVPIVFVVGILRVDSKALLECHGRSLQQNRNETSGTSRFVRVTKHFQFAP